MRPHTNLVLASLIAFLSAPLFADPPTFATREAVPLLEPVVTLADINKDGYPDIVAAVPNVEPNPTGYQISIQLGNSKGTFTQGRSIDLGSTFVPIAITTGDFNQDGLQDIAVISDTEQALYVILQQPLGGFLVNPIQIAANTSQTLNLVAADMNRDNLLDLVIPTATGTILLLNNGGGRFRPPLYASSTPSVFAAVADFNNDKKADLITIGGYCCFPTVLVQLGDGRGGFDSPSSQPLFLGQVSPTLTVADFNHDGKADLAVSSQYPIGVFLLNGNGDGTFGTATSLSLPSQFDSAYGVIAADINSDGIPDLLTLANNSQETALLAYTNGGKGTFSAGVPYLVQIEASFAAAADINRDGSPDVVITSKAGSAASVLINNGKDGFHDGETIPTATSPFFMVAGDFNADGHPDLVTLSPSGVTAYLNTGEDKSLFSPLTPLPFSGQSLVVGDFNNDQRLDVAVLNNGNGQTLLGNGDGSFFYLPRTYGVGPVSANAVAADMNGDGKLDIVTNNPVISLGNGDGTFLPGIAPAFPCNNEFSSINVADFNRDGKLDVLISCQSTLYLYQGNGDGTLQAPLVPAFAPGMLDTAVGDFNRDGIPDIAFSSSLSFFVPGSTQVSILIGQGNGTFAPGVVIPVLTGQSGQIVAADFNGNGILDLAVLDDFDSVFSILSGNGDGTFRPARAFGISSDPVCIVSGRFQSNSKPGERDLAVCSGPGIGVALNTTQ